jgi:ATP diphosphatase
MHNINDLLHLMSRLRNPKTGCAWDLKQDFLSLIPYTLEEVYEVVDAIQQEDWAHVNDELGDLLFQVIFYAQIGKEQATFDFSTVVDNLVTKMLRRHPHVFPDGTLNSEMDVENQPTQAQINQNWEAIKAQEKSFKSIKNERWLDAVPVAMPALMRAQKLQKKAASIGFDWPDMSGVFSKFHEELNELEEAFEQGDNDAQEDEMGDVLFSLVNLARHLNINPDTALTRTNRKFIARFNYIEQTLIEQGSSLQAASLEEMDSLWNQAKTVLMTPKK